MFSMLKPQSTIPAKTKVIQKQEEEYWRFSSRKVNKLILENEPSVDPKNFP